MTVRLPRRLASAELILHEQRWLPEVAVDLPLPVPVPIRVGRPSKALGYPWAWTVAPWFPGGAAEHHQPGDLGATARRLGEFLAAVHRPAPADAPANPWRGTPLASRTERLLVALDELGDVLDREAVLRRWESLLAAPPWSAPPVWLHGDVHPLNLLVDQGQLSAVLDFGDICAGDPASDLAVAWMMFPPAERDVFRAAAQVDDDTWRRAQGWALSLGVVFTNGDEAITAIGQRTVAAVLADDG
jgi:aminoglycoside phosphotransferase (APT) family kinase protein